MFPSTYGARLLQVTTKTSPPAANSVNGDPRGSGSIMSNCGGSSNGSVNGGDSTGPVRVAVLFAGRQASGGHNIIWGLHEYLKGTGSTVLGVVGGTVGLFEQSTVEVTDELLDAYRNQGGFDLLGRSRDSIRTESELAKAKEACAELDLDGLVV
ncbi:unnamed protein product, partial [Ectocarpus fasciculatus]